MHVCMYVCMYACSSMHVCIYEKQRVMDCLCLKAWVETFGHRLPCLAEARKKHHDLLPIWESVVVSKNHQKFLEPQWSCWPCGVEMCWRDRYLCVTKFLDNKAEQMREDKTEKWNVQITMIDAFLRESQTKNVFEDKLKWLPLQLGETWAIFLHYCRQVRSGANCPKNRCRKNFLARALGKPKRLVS